MDPIRIPIQVHCLPRDRLNLLHHASDKMTGLLTHQVTPFQPGNIIVCDNLPFVVSNNGKIYNFMGGSMKQLYIAEPSEHKF